MDGNKKSYAGDDRDEPDDAGERAADEPDGGPAYWRRLWAFGTSPYGLGLDELAFWDLTLSEFRALKRVRKDCFDENRIQIAQLRADLHNIHYRSEKTDKVWTAAMFMPGYQETAAGVDWKRDAAATRLMAEATRKMTPIERRAMAETVGIFQERQRRAMKARGAGAGSEAIKAIMEGLDG